MMSPLPFRSTLVALALLLLVPALVGAGRTVLSSFPGESLFSSILTGGGLPNGSVGSIVEDRHGFLWFGTQGGLVRYDGTHFDLWENVPFSTGVLSHNQTQTLFMDGDHLWVGTYGGLNRFGVDTGEVEVWRHDPEDPMSLSNDLVISIARDAKGRLWVGTQKGLNLMDEEREPSAASTPTNPGAPCRVT